MMNGSKMHTVKMWAGKVMWLVALLALIMAWVASANADGVICLRSRGDTGACPGGGLPVAHLFLDSLALGLLALGIKCGMNCGMCKMGEDEA